MAREIRTGQSRVGVRAPQGGGRVSSTVASAGGGPRVSAVQADPQYGLRALAGALQNLSGALNTVVDQEMRVQAKKAERVSSEAGARWGLVGDIADLQLPTGDSIGEEAFRRSAIQAASANVELRAREEVDKLAQQFPGKPEAFRKALEERTPALLEGIDPSLAVGAANAISTLGQRYYVQADEDRKTYIKDQSRAAMVELSDAKVKSAAILARRGDLDGALSEVGGLAQTMADAGPVAGGGSGAFSLTDLSEIQIKATDKIRGDFLEGWVERTPNKRAALDGLRKGKTGNAAVDGVLAVSDPSLTDQMANRLEADIRAEETAARAAAALAKAEKAARRSVASDVVRDTVFALQAGKMPPSLADAKKLAAEFPDLASQVSVAETQREAAAEFSTLPALERENLLNQIAADPNMDRISIEFAQALNKRHKDLAGNPDRYSAAVDAGLVPPTPLDITDPTSVAARMGAADEIEARWGERTSGIRDDEIETIKTQLDGMTPEDQAATLGAMSSLMGDKFERVLPQIASKDPSTAMAAKLGQARPQLAAEVLRGRQLIKEGAVQSASADDYATAAQSMLGTALMHSPSAYAAVLESATALDAERRFGAGGTAKDSYDEDGFRQAITDITGGVYEYNGQAIIAPDPGVDEDTFEQVVQAIDDADLSTATDEGRAVLPTLSTGGRLTAEAFKKYATLESVGDGKYLVKVANGYALDPTTNQPFLFDWQANTRGAQARLAGEARSRRESLLPLGGGSNDDLGGGAGNDRLQDVVNVTGGGINPQLSVLLQRLLGRGSAPTYDPPGLTAEAVSALGIPAKKPRQEAKAD